MKQRQLIPFVHFAGSEPSNAHPSHFSVLRVPSWWGNDLSKCCTPFWVYSNLYSRTSVVIIISLGSIMYRLVRTYFLVLTPLDMSTMEDVFHKH